MPLSGRHSFLGMRWLRRIDLIDSLSFALIRGRFGERRYRLITVTFIKMHKCIIILVQCRYLHRYRVINWISPLALWPVYKSFYLGLQLQTLLSGCSRSPIMFMLCHRGNWQNLQHTNTYLIRRATHSLERHLRESKM